MNEWLNQLVADIHQKEGSFGDKPDVPEEVRFYEVSTRCGHDYWMNICLHSLLNRNVLMT